MKENDNDRTTASASSTKKKQSCHAYGEMEYELHTLFSVRFGRIDCRLNGGCMHEEKSVPTVGQMSETGLNTISNAGLSQIIWVSILSFYYAIQNEWRPASWWHFRGMAKKSACHSHCQVSEKKCLLSIGNHRLCFLVWTIWHWLSLLYTSKAHTMGICILNW